MSDAPQTPTAPATAGTLLRQAREAAGLHIATLAAMLKVPVQRIEALEQDRYEALPDVTFTRALALSVCRTLKIDAGPILAALPAVAAPSLGHAVEAIGAPMPREEAGVGWLGGDALRRRWPLWAALALVALAAALWVVLPPAPAPSGGLNPTPSAADASAASGSASDAGAASLAEQVRAEPQRLASGPSSAAGGDAGTAAPLAAVASEAAPAGGADGGTAPRRAQRLRLQAREPSWVQVIGASGQVRLQRTLQPGETVSFDEDEVLAVTVGRADATEVWVHGQPFDLTPRARNNVARFEVR
ncbi:helix-turn-helix domain-containing protein [Tepidimonas charontis]|uniref:Cytoskeleton protein RodZ n=1 Tax=Tepidimonas charontis TaxID=2267262 RepID=A0A554XKY5_9BURK|nr:helix-turn-helix domain-containing protein [Tepidimonas charontis]TSE36458.1 Cytoskeleton protein RodZ [Tepidimonas charontis]